MMHGGLTGPVCERGVILISAPASPAGAWHYNGGSQDTLTRSLELSSTHAPPLFMGNPVLIL